MAGSSSSPASPSPPRSMPSCARSARPASTLPPLPPANLPRRERRLARLHRASAPFSTPLSDPVRKIRLGLGVVLPVFPIIRAFPSRLIRPGVTASLLVTFPGLLSGEGVNAGSRVDGLTTLDYIIRPRRPILSFLLSHPPSPGLAWRTPQSLCLRPTESRTTVYPAGRSLARQDRPVGGVCGVRSRNQLLNR